MRKYSKELLDNFSLEELDSFDDEQIEKLDIEDFKSLFRMRESVKKAEEQARLFWLNEYPKLSKSEKVRVWGSDVYRSMRWQGESGYDEYAIFNERWLKSALEEDPDFMSLLPEIYDMQGMSFDSEKAD